MNTIKFDDLPGEIREVYTMDDKWRIFNIEYPNHDTYIIRLRGKNKTVQRDTWKFRHNDWDITKVEFF